MCACAGPASIDNARMSQSPHFTGLPFANAERVIQTHANIVVLKGDRAYKLKKPVKFPFLDYSTLEMRRHFVSEEVRLNRRFSPEIYLDTCEVFEQAGELYFSQPGTKPGVSVVDYALIMRRIPEPAWLPAQINAGTVPQRGLHSLTQRIVDAVYAQAPTQEVQAAGLPENIARNTVANIAECERFVGRCLTREQFTRLDRLLRAWFSQNPAMFLQRVKEGRIRDGHGDLKPGNIAFVDNQPVITDCIEFGTQWRYLDTLAEIAFLATGLESMGQFPLAREIFGHYQTAARDDFPAPLRRYYQAHFACVMGKVTALQLDEPEVPVEIKARARVLAAHYFTLADFHAREPHLICVAGIMGCGKSTLATQLSERLGWPRYSSDECRKELAGVRPEVRLPQSAYTPNMDKLVQEALRAKALKAMAAGSGVIVEAQFPRQGERAAMVATVEALKGPALFVLCDAPDEVVRARMARREQESNRVSDATADLLDQARQRFEPITDSERLNLIRVDTRDPVGEIADQVLRSLLGASFSPAEATRP